MKEDIDVTEYKNAFGAKLKNRRIIVIDSEEFGSQILIKKLFTKEELNGRKPEDAFLIETERGVLVSLTFNITNEATEVLYYLLARHLEKKYLQEYPKE